MLGGTYTRLYTTESMMTPSSINTTDSMPPPYEATRPQCLPTAASAPGAFFDAPPPAYDFTDARGAPPLLSVYTAPAMGIASSPPAYSAVAEYPSHEELKDRLPAKNSIFGSSKVRRRRIRC